MARSRATRQRMHAAAGASPASGAAASPAELPADIWQTILKQLGHTDLLRGADEAARDIAATACTCRTARDAAGAGWLALWPADSNKERPPLRETDDVTNMWYAKAKKLSNEGQKGPIRDNQMLTIIEALSHSTHSFTFRNCYGFKDEEYSATLAAYHDWLRSLLPLHSRSCPLSALKSALMDRHYGIRAPAAIKQFRLTKRDLEGLRKDSQHLYKLSEVRALARQKWTDIQGLQERQQKLNDTAAKRKAAAAARRQEEETLRLRLFKQALAAAGVEDGCVEPIMQMATSQAFLGTEPPLVIGGIDMSGRRDGLAPFRGEPDEAPAWALRARREYSGVEDGFEEPDDMENPYEGDEGEVEVQVQVLYFGGGLITNDLFDAEVSTQPSTRFGRVMAHFCFMADMELGQLEFYFKDKLVKKVAYGKTLAQLGVKAGATIEARPAPQKPTWVIVPNDYAGGFGYGDY